MSKPKKKRKRKPYKECLICGEKDNDKFYPKLKSKCINCISLANKKRYKNKIIEESLKISKTVPPCKKCGENGKIHFYPHNKSFCKKCICDALADKRRSLKQENEGKVVILSKQKRYNKSQKTLRVRIIGAKNRALKKGYDFDLTIEYLETLLKKQHNRCYYSDIEFDNNDPIYSLSLDRIDSKFGYIQGNIRLVCSYVNYMKQEHSEKVLFDFVVKIHNKHVLDKNNEKILK